MVVTQRLTGQARGRRTRETLIQVAIQSLCESHLYGLRFSAISKTANVPQPLIDYHFPNIEVLLSEMIRHQLDRLKLASVEAIEANSANPRRALAAYVRVPFDMCAKEAGFRAVWSAYYHMATINKSFADFNRDMRKAGQERIADLLAQISAEKKPSRRKLNETARAIQGLITGFVCVAASETGSDYKNLADLAVKSVSQLVQANLEV